MARRPLSSRLRFSILNRDNFTCQYCGSSAPDVVLHVDHKLPVSRGGGNDEGNLITACSSCNLGKGTQEAEEPIYTGGPIGRLGKVRERLILNYYSKILIDDQMSFLAHLLDQYNMSRTWDEYIEWLEGYCKSIDVHRKRADNG